MTGTSICHFVQDMNKRRVSIKRRGVFVKCSNKRRGHLLEVLRYCLIALKVIGWHRLQLDT